MGMEARLLDQPGSDLGIASGGHQDDGTLR